MKPALVLSAPPLAFIAAAMLAGLVPHEEIASVTRQATPLSPGKRAEFVKESATSDIPSLLSEMERQMVHFPPPELVIHDGKGMEARLLHERYSGQKGGLMSAFRYSFEWAKNDPAGMFEWFNQYPTDSVYERQSLTETLFSEWPKQDMAAALAAIPLITHAESRAQALVSTLEVLCQKDPARARELLLQNLDNLEPLKTVHFGYEAGNARTELLLALPPGRIRSLLLSEHINILSRTYGDGKAALAVELCNRCSNEEKCDLVTAGLRSDRTGEFQLDGLEDLIKQHAETTHDPAQASRFLDQYGGSWAEREPDRALAWAMEHLKGKERTDQSLSLLAHAASKNFDGAMRVWQSLPEDSLRDRAAKILADAAPAGHEVEKATLLDSLPQAGQW